ncbi:MAG: TIM barrel protein [Planctomycetaceae bacterium]
MADRPEIILSAFADEAANTKSVVEQMAAMSALGLRYYSPRFLDITGEGKVQHVVDLNKADTNALKKRHAEYGMSVTSIGSRIGKVKLKDSDDGSHNKFVPFKKYRDNDVAQTISQAVALETKLVRGFSFYHPKGEKPQPYIAQAVEQIGKITEKCAAAGIVYGLEIEPNLVGETGPLLAELAKKVNHPNLVLVYDGGNVAAQNKNRLQVLEEFKACVKYVGWVHIKDYTIDKTLEWTGVVDEERLKNFVPADVGDAGHELFLRELRAHIPRIEKQMKKLGAPGVFLEAEPHLKGGGQFGGFSGPDGMGVAVRALCRVLDYVDIGYRLRDFDDIRQARGF